MTWAIASRRGATMTALAVFAGLVAGIGNGLSLPIPLPAVASAAPALPLTVLPALVVVLGATWCARGGEERWMLGSTLDPRWHSRVMVGCGIAITCMTAGLAAGAAALWEASPGAGEALPHAAVQPKSSPLAVASVYGRDLAVFTAIAALGERLGLGPAAEALPALGVLVVSLFSRDATGRLHWWAWPLNSEGLDPAAWGMGLVCAAGAIALGRRR